MELAEANRLQADAPFLLGNGGSLICNLY